MLYIRRLRLPNFLARRERRDLYHDSYKQSKLLIYFLKSILNYNYISELRKIMLGTSGLCTRGSFWFPTQRESIFFQISVRKRFRDRRFLAKHDSTTTWFQGRYEMKLYDPQFIYGDFMRIVWDLFCLQTAVLYEIERWSQVNSLVFTIVPASRAVRTCISVNCVACLSSKLKPLSCSFKENCSLTLDLLTTTSKLYLCLHHKLPLIIHLPSIRFTSSLILRFKGTLSIPSRRSYKDWIFGQTDSNLSASCLIAIASRESETGIFVMSLWN